MSLVYRPDDGEGSSRRLDIKIGAPALSDAESPRRHPTVGTVSSLSSLCRPIIRQPSPHETGSGGSGYAEANKEIILDDTGDQVRERDERQATGHDCLSRLLLQRASRAGCCQTSSSRTDANAGESFARLAGRCLMLSSRRPWTVF